MNILILGPQGSGKGTQAKLLAEKFGFYYFEMGSFLRELAKKNPEIDRIINKEGKLLPDDMFFFSMKEFLQEKISAGSKGMILEGFPRTVKQYQMLKRWFDQEGIKIDKVIFLEISDEEAVRRLSARRTCEKCGRVYNLITNPPKTENCECGGKLVQREDDQPERIKVRLNAYKESTLPLLEIFKKEGVLEQVDGGRPIEKIHQELVKIVREN